jgi:hypothetical protein
VEKKSIVNDPEPEPAPERRSSPLFALGQPAQPDAERDQPEEGGQKEMKGRVRKAEDEAAGRDPTGARRNRRDAEPH